MSEKLPHGYSHDTRSDGTTVVKRFGGPAAEQRRETERAALTALAGLLPVPPLLDGPAGALAMTHLPGVHGQDLIAAGHAEAVLHACGRMLRRIQAVDVRVVFPQAPPGAVLVHGDYGPNNMLLDPLAVLDWEWAHPGTAVEDLAWCEWTVRFHHPAHATALDALFAGYGHRPAWADRKAAMLAKCRWIVDVYTADAAVTEHWRRRIALTDAWPDQL